MEFVKILEICIVALYFSGALLFPGGVLGRKPALKRFASLCAAGGFALHTLELVLHFFTMQQAMLQEGQLYFSLGAWILLAIFYLFWWKQRLDFLGLLASPLALFLYLSSMSVPGAKVTMPPAMPGWFVALHVGCLFLALALLAMAFGAGGMFMHLERKIKAKEKLEGFRQDLPSLHTFDKANELAVMWGFPLYTIGLLSGFIWGRFTWGKLITGDPKEIVSLFIWLLYAYLFHQRLTVGWRGRKAALIAMLVFLLSVVSLLAVNFLMTSHHNFTM